jgi:hypothetical protein
LNKAVAKDSSKDLKTRCGAVIKSLKGDFSDVQVGKTRILYRANSHRYGCTPSKQTCRQ